MNKRSHIHKKPDSSASNPVLSQLQSRPFIAQAKPQSQKPLTQTETENQEFQQQKFEATKPELQAKYGTITPEGQERLTVLQAKMSGSLQRRLENAPSNGSNFANIPISRPDAPLQQAVQTKLTIGEPGDKFEIAADKAADDFVNRYHARAPVSGQAQQNLQLEDKSVEEKELQRKPMLQLRSAKVGMTAAPQVEAAIQQARGSGQTMPEKIRKPYELHAGADYSRVKIHTDRRADQINRWIGAEASAIGTDVFFREGNFRPGTKKGDLLMRHELEHVGQQNGAAVQRVPTVEEQDTLLPTDIVPNQARKVLLVGEGNFSFALSLATQVQPQQAQNIVATSYDSAEEVTSKYQQAPNNISQLRNRQVQVLHGIDATQIDPSLGPFSSIVFNFPFVEGPRGHDQQERNQQLLQKFFLSAVNALEVGGKIFMTTKEHWLRIFSPQQLCNWAGLTLDDQKPGGKVKFNFDNFPGYEHRETHQDRQASNLETAYTLIFKKSL